MAALYQVSEELRVELEKATDNDTGEVLEEALQEISNREEDFDNKAVAVAAYIKNLSAEATAIGEAMKGMDARYISLTLKVSRLSRYLKENMESVGKDKISCPYFDIKVKLCPVSVNIVDESIIPEAYIKCKETYSIDKMAIKHALSNGLEVPGADFITNRRLEIK